MGSVSHFHFDISASAYLINEQVNQQLQSEIEAHRQTTLSSRNVLNVPRVHEAFRAGSHFTHILDHTTGEIVEYRAESASLLNRLLSQHGFPEEAPVLQVRQPRAPRASVTTLNRDRRLFLLGDIDTDAYMYSVAFYLEFNHAHRDVLDYLTVFADRLTEESFCPKGERFNDVLEKSFNDFQQDNPKSKLALLPHQEALPTDYKADVEESDRKNLPKLKKAISRQGITLAYANLRLKADPKGTERHFYKVITEFAKGKIENRLWDLEEVAQNSDDHAQQIAIYVWEHLSDFRGEPESFYPWLHRICFGEGWKAFNETKEYTNARVPVLVEAEDEDDEAEKEELNAVVE